MASVSVRNLPDHIHQRLRVRAAENGRSMEAEIRSILEQALSVDSKPQDLSELRGFLARLLGDRKPESLVDEFIAERRREAAREALES